MYFNNVHILYYVVVGIVGLIIGQFMDWCNHRLPEHKKVFSKDFIKELKQNFKPNYLLMLLTAVFYASLLYRFGIQNSFVQNIDLLKYLILTPMLLSVFVIDYHHQIIPNRLVLTMFEIGLIFTFLYGISDINIAIHNLIGMVVGAGVFLLITWIGKLIAGKEAMGFGDVKLMGALGLYFGFSSIIGISLIAFLIGAILSILLLVLKVKKADEYIPFGPFIVIATFITMFVPFNLILTVLLKIFTLGLYRA